MANMPDLLFPLDEHLMRLEPAVFLESGVFVKTRRGADEGARFVTTRGVVHALRQFLPRAVLNDHFIRRNAASIRTFFQTEMERARFGNSSEELWYFTEQLLPAFEERDWSTASTPDVTVGGVPPDSRTDPSGMIDTLSRMIPAVFLPIPSVLILGRLRSLCTVKSPGLGYHVRFGHEVLAPTGEEIPVNLLESRWRLDVRAWLSRTLVRLTESAMPAESADLRRSRAEIHRVGYFQRGDVLFLQGSPPLVGHVLPPHFNRALGRSSQRDLAMVAPLTIPPRIVSPRVYSRTSDGRWVPLHLPHGLCLGGKPPEVRPENPGLALLALLRWAAARVAANGAFHALDDHVGAACEF
jgi:hypothetical protein